MRGGHLLEVVAHGGSTVSEQIISSTKSPFLLKLVSLYRCNRK